MQTLFCLLFTNVFIFTSYNTYSKVIIDKKTDTDTSIISREYLDIIECTDSVVWYLLDPMSEDTTSLRLNNNIEILFHKADTITDRINSFKYTLLNPKSFVVRNLVKECTFLPDVAACLYSEKGTLYFYYSFYCDLCRFSSNEKYLEIDGELIRKEILGIVCDIFPNDRYFRNLKRREK